MLHATWEVGASGAVLHQLADVLETIPATVPSAEPQIEGGA
jgi:hypothetical protein